MRVVLDTNIFVSAVIREDSTSARAIGAVIDKHRLLVSEATKQELVQVLERPKIARFVSIRFVAWLSKVFSIMELITITETVTDCRDKKDNKFLELAISGHADLIISIDNDLLVLHPFRGMPILTPNQFLALAD